MLALALSAQRAAQACNEGASNPGAGELKAVKVASKREGDITRFYVENKELCEITMTFDFALVNLAGEVEFPYTASFPPGQVTEAFALAPVDKAAKWEYSYTNYFKLGSNCSSHDDDYLYQLPYEAGKQYKVTQAANGSYSHKGSNKYAIDWKMKEGTMVHAARSGLVVKTKEDSNKGGPSLKYDKYNNYVLVRHDDGTLGHYCHLQKDGVLVKAGDRVAAGQAIARSGNTGFSSGPHLHFCVFRTKSGKERESVPVKFRVAGGRSATLTTGVSYQAADVIGISAADAGTDSRPAGGAGS